MADNVLAQVPRKRYPTLDEQMRSDIVNYLSRLKSDFVTSGERAGQGLGQVIDDGNYLEGVPRVVLGGLGALSAPVSAAVSPVLGPLLQPVGEAVDTYVGQPIEQATGYPADITNEVFLTTATAGLAPFLKPALKGTGNFLAKMGDAAEAGLNRVGYTARPQAGTLFSGAGPVKMSDMERRTAYHVAPSDHSGDLLSLYRQMGTDAYDEFIRRWPDADPAMGQYHAHQVHLYNTLDEAKKHTPQGKIYEINLNDVEAVPDALEPSLRHLVVQDRIPASALREVSSGGGPVNLADDVAGGGQVPVYYHAGGKLNARNFSNIDKYGDELEPGSYQQVYWVTPDKSYAEIFAKPASEGGIHSRDAAASIYSYRLRDTSTGKLPDSQLDLTNIGARDSITPEQFGEALTQQGVRLDRGLLANLDETLNSDGKGAEVWQYLKKPDVMREIARQHGSVKINEWADDYRGGVESETVGVLNPNLLQRVAQSGGRTAVIRPNAIPRDLRGGLLPADGKWVRPKDKRRKP